MSKFLRLVAVLIVSVLFTEKVAAQQDVELVNSAQVLYEGGLYYGLGKYTKAANAFKKISRNDTNYAVALLDLCYSYREDKEDSLCWESARKGLNIESPYRADFYTFAGSSLREMKKYDDAIKTLDDGIKEYPYVYILYYDKGLCYYDQKKLQEAEKWFQQALVINPFHALSNYYLGKTLLDEGRTVPALLAFESYLIMTTSNDRADKVVVTIEDVYKNNYEYDPDTKMEASETGDDCFNDLLDIITSEIALKPSYKNKTGIHFDFVKVRQAMFEAMTYKENTGNWYMENYIPFFIALQKDGHFTAFNYWTLSSIEDATVQKGWKKNKKKIRAFAGWVNTYLSDNSKHPARDLVTDKKDADIIFYDNRMVLGIGHTNPTTKKPYGEWTYFYSTSGKILGQGTYNNMGKMDGEWTYYHPNGQVKEKSMYKNGIEDGSSEFWWDNGEKHSVSTYKAGLLEGPFEVYTFSGALDTKGSYVKGKLNGPLTLYYDNDKPRLEMVYVNGKINGDAKVYYKNGKPESEIKVTMDKKNGPTKEYYPDGSLQAEGAYKNDLESGNWKVYYRSGKLFREGTYKTPGKREGVWKEYYEDGKVSYEGMYKSGKPNGTAKWYEEDGHVSSEKTWKSGKLVRETYYDSKGKVLGDYTIEKGRTEVKQYYADGSVASEGDYLDGMLDGQWTFYSDNGGWKMAHVNYAYDDYDGRTKYYYPNGKVQYETDYKQGVEHGYRKTYYRNGNIEEEGWVIDDMKQGDWFEYNQRGIMTSHTYYLNDGEYGTQEFFDARGRTREEVKLKHGVGVERFLYDSTGKTQFTFNTPNGTGDFKPLYNNGSAWHEGKFFRGYRDGLYRKYAWDGRVVWEGTYVMGNLDGSRKMYYDWDKQLYNDASIKEGNLDGKSVGYWENGQKRWEENYVNGDLDGEQRYYHDNGQLQRVSTWKDGELDGELKYYSPDSMLEYIRYYRDGVLLGYSYEGTDGTVLPMKTLDEGSGKVEAYYRNGKKSMTGEFANGTMNGNWIEYYSDGSVKEDENYVYDDRDGEQKRYYPDGKLQEIEHFYFGAVDGECRYFYPNGNLKRVEYYTLDEEWSRWYFYNENGELTTTRLFYAGVQQDEVVVPVVTPAETNPKTKPKPKTK